jgi:anti-sigma regulatory factor (Ser/Thr protein kinase)
VAPALELAVFEPDDIIRAQAAAKRFALELGFDPTAIEEIAIVISELASNLVKHAQGGRLTLSPASRDQRSGIRIESNDRGPGIVHVESAMADGFSTSGSLGYGLGTVNRLMDEFQITSQQPQGTYILSQKWQHADSAPETACPLEFGVATRPFPGMEVNGDAFVIKHWGSSALIGVIDGLGHGEFAHLAAETARQFIETHYDQPLDAPFRGVARVCRSTRGVVMALARFDFGPQVSGFKENTPASVQSEIGAGQPWIRLSFGSIGNIEVRVRGNHAPMNFMVLRGVLGGSAPKVVITEHTWELGNLMVLHSDGLRTHWIWEDFPELTSQSAGALAQQLLSALAKDEDDATVIVVKGAHA